MSITVVGSVAYDTVTTGYGKSIRQLGGSAIHFSIAASKFTNVYPVGVYGDDFENSDIELLIDNSINISNLKKQFTVAIEEIEIVKENITFKIPGKLN